MKEKTMAYDLEDAIMKAWQTSEDLDLFFRHHGDHPKPMTEDEVSNMILGIKQIHDMRMEQLYDMYKQKFELDEYCKDPEALALREKMFGDRVKEVIKPKKKGKKK
jgi:hypothetical protein